MPIGEEVASARPNPRRPPSTANGVFWAGISQFARVVFQFVALAVLSRLLAPEAFGLLAMAGVVTTFAMLLRDMGTASAIIQRETLDTELLDTVFWFNVCLGAALGIIVIGLSRPLALAFGEPRLSGVLAALAISFPISSSSAVHQALLERASRFQTLAQMEIASSFIALALSVLAALKGFGAYSLVVNAVSTIAITSLMLWLRAPWKPTARWSAKQFRLLWGFSGNLASFQVLNYFARNADTMLIGRELGAMDLAWYNTGYKVMLFPITSLSSVVSRAMFPVLSRSQSNNVAFGALYLKTVAAIALVTAPLMAALWAVRVPFVQVVFGDRWLPVAQVIAWLSPVGLIQSLLTTVGLVYMGKGQTRLMMWWGLCASGLAVLAIIVGLRWGYLGVARSYALVNIVLIIPGFHIPLKLIGLNALAVFGAIWRPLALAVSSATTMFILDNCVVGALPPIIRLSALLCVGAITYVFLSYIFLRQMLTSILIMFRDARRGHGWAESQSV